MSSSLPSEKHTSVNPYLFFPGTCEAAINFYSQAVGANLAMLMRYDQSPDPVPGADMSVIGQRVMHAMFSIGETVIFASDGIDDSTPISGFALSLNLPNLGEMDRAFAALAEGGQVTMPLGQTFWAERFGMLIDRFGVSWMVSLAADMSDNG